MPIIIGLFILFLLITKGWIYVLITAGVIIVIGLGAALIRAKDTGDRLQEENISAELVWNVKYLGGIQSFIIDKPTDALIIVDTKNIVFVMIDDLKEQIELNNIKNATVETRESLSASKLVLVGIFAFALKDRTNYLRLTYINDIDEEANAIFEASNGNLIAQTIMNKRYQVIKEQREVTTVST
jgi:hypothetical protein